jgi:hypothetical protein
MRVQSRMSISFSKVCSKGYFIPNLASTPAIHIWLDPGSRRKSNLTRHGSVSAVLPWDGLSMSHKRDLFNRSFVRYASRQAPSRLVSVMARIEYPSSIWLVITRSTQSKPCSVVLTTVMSTGGNRLPKVLKPQMAMTTTMPIPAHNTYLYRRFFTFGPHRKSKILHRKSPEFGTWFLELLWCLVLGTWSFRRCP